MQEALHRVHQHDDSQRNVQEEVDSDDDDQSVGTRYSTSDSLLQEDLGELAVSKRQGPKTQVGGSVGDAAKNELDCFDDLMHGDLANIVLLMAAVGVVFFYVSLLLLCNKSVRNLIFGELLVDIVFPMLFVGRGCRHFAPKDEWLEDQHPRHAKQSSHEQVVLQTLLTMHVP